MNTLKFTRLLFGLFLYALGLVFSVQANLGVTPWNTFHMGLAQQTGMTLGTAIVITGLCIVLLNYFAKQKMGIGTLLNMLLIGVFVDLQIHMELIPEMHALPGGLFMIFASMFTIAIASWLYIGAGLGAGPRDGLMVTLMHWTGKPVGIIRASIETTVLLIGILLGGKFGIGTPIIAILLGPICQWTFKALNFDVKNIEHQYLELKQGTE
jgi:uncharacterized membrane protein YczE